MTGGATKFVWRRHDLLRIRPDAWKAIFATLPEHVRVDVLSTWAENAYPLIVRRYFPAESHDSVPVGVPLPPYLGKQRIAILLAPEDVAGRVAPVFLRTARDLAPPAWVDMVSVLLNLGKRYGAEPRIVGSLLWEQLTSLPYLTEVSDLDLLWPPSAVCRPFLDELAAIDRCSPVRLDGELDLSDGSAVNWRELHGCFEGVGEKTVLVKSMTGIQIQSVDAVLRLGQPL